MLKSLNLKKGDLLLINVTNRLSVITDVDENYIYLHDLKSGNTTKNSLEFINKHFSIGLFTYYPFEEVDVQV